MNDYSFLSTVASGSEGIMLVDKPSGVTSHDVVSWARRLTGIKRIGHTGTLDPLASGLLIILIGRQYTKLQAEFLKQDKEYLCEIRLGAVSDTYDIEGQIQETVTWEELSLITKEKLEKTLPSFRGKIEQVVPAFSAVKVGGRKLYVAARRGQTKLEALPKRQVLIKELELINWQVDSKQKNIHFSIRVNCSSGTYIRSLAHDIGQSLGVGAVVVKLRRTLIGELNLKQAVVCPLPLIFAKKERIGKNN
jgi:tRNA pseudouridine55 synthase